MWKRLERTNGVSGSPVGPKGVVLVITILVVGLMLVMGVTLINLASSDYQVANNESRSIQALFNADAGLEEAKMRLSPNAPGAMAIPVGVATAWRAYISTDPDAATVTQAVLKARVQAVDPTYNVADEANYTVYPSVQTSNIIRWGWLRIQHKVDGAGNPLYYDSVPGHPPQTTASSQVFSGTPVTNFPIVIVTAEGIKDPVRRMISIEYWPQVAPPTGTSTIVTDPFNDAAHGKGDVTPGTPVIELIGNASTDSYDSRNGAYTPSPATGNRNAHGDVSTDASADGSITLTSTSVINGNVVYGPTGTATAVSNNGTINGTISAEPAVWNLPLPAIPAGLTNQGALNPGNPPHGQTCSRTLSTGSYWFSSISLSGNAQLCVSGAVKIYVTGAIDIGGNGVATANNLPPSLLIYGTRDPTSAISGCTSANCATSVDIHGNGNFYGAVYAPNAAIRVSGNGEVFGALTGNTIQINGSAHGGFHYDEALGHVGETTTTVPGTSYSPTGYTRYSWREIAF